MKFVGSFEFALLPYQADRGFCHYAFDGTYCHFQWYHDDAPGRVLGSASGSYTYDGHTLRTEMQRSFGHGPAHVSDEIRLSRDDWDKLRNGTSVDVQLEHVADGRKFSAAAHVWQQAQARPSFPSSPALLAAAAVQQTFVWKLDAQSWDASTNPKITWVGSVPQGQVTAVRQSSSSCASTLVVNAQTQKQSYTAGSHCHNAATWTVTAAASGCHVQTAQLDLTDGQTVTVSYGTPDIAVPQINYYYSIDGAAPEILGVATFGTTP